MRQTPPQVLLVAALAVLISGTATALHRGTAGEQAAVATGPGPDDKPPTVESTTTTTSGGPGEPAGSPVPEATTTAPEPVRSAAAAPDTPAPDPVAAALPGPLIPKGKGMWLHQLSHTGGVRTVIARAQEAGLTHLYLRVGSSKMGFYGQSELDRLLPAAHAAGLKVIGWDFVYLFDPIADAERSAEAIAYTTPDGHRMDAFSADIETAAEGVNLTAEGALAYGAKLRELVGPGYPLIATVPRPSPRNWFPFAEATEHFDVIAPMVYWMNRDPASDVAGAIADLAPLGKPILPIGQAYDGSIDGGPAGDPPKDALVRFMDTALDRGALGVSFWVWHHATPEQWSAITEARAWELTTGEPTSPAGVAYLQRLLTHLGQPTAADGVLGPQTRASLRAVQSTLGVPATGELDGPTISSLFRP